MIRYLSRKEVAERIGVTPDALSRYRLPVEDALTGSTRGWLPVTIDRWQEQRPGRGARTDLPTHAAVRTGGSRSPARG